MGDFTFSGQATAVALTTGAAAKSDYQDGMAVFIMPDAGSVKVMGHDVLADPL